MGGANNGSWFLRRAVYVAAHIIIVMRIGQFYRHQPAHTAINLGMLPSTRKCHHQLGCEHCAMQQHLLSSLDWHTQETHCHSVSSIQYQSYTPGYTTASLSQTHKINRAPTKNNDSVTLQKCSHDYNCRLS
jgi:hypothetical protein